MRQPERHTEMRLLPVGAAQRLKNARQEHSLKSENSGSCLED